MNIESFYYPKLATLPDAWKKSSFTGIGALWILSSDMFSPSDYKIRKIRDQGSIKISITNSSIDFFGRQFEEGNVLSKSLQGVKRAVALMGLLIFAAPLGCLWHLGNSIYHTVLWIKKGRDHTHFKEHFISLIHDLAWTMFTYAIIFDIFIAKKSICRLPRVSSVLSFALPLALIFGIDVACLFVDQINKPAFLKKKFGIVGENGWLLTFNRETDVETRNRKGWPNEIKPRGHFYDLWRKQAIGILRKFREIVVLLQLELNEEQLKAFSEDPEKFMFYLNDVLKESNRPLPYDKDQLKTLFDQAKHFFYNYNEMKDYLLQVLFPRKLPTFVFTPEVCQYYFQAKLTPLGSVMKLLIDLQDSCLLEGGPSEEFIVIKQDILSAENPYEILGLKIDATKEACKEAYIKRALQIHPDKTPEEWQAQAAELFNAMNEAYKYISAIIV